MTRAADDFKAIRARMEELRRDPAPAEVTSRRGREVLATGTTPHGRLTPGGNVCMLCGGVIDQQWISSRCTGGCMPHSACPDPEMG